MQIWNYCNLLWTQKIFDKLFEASLILSLAASSMYNNSLQNDSKQIPPAKVVCMIHFVFGFECCILGLRSGNSWVWCDKILCEVLLIHLLFSLQVHHAISCCLTFSSTEMEKVLASRLLFWSGKHGGQSMLISKSFC